jgi:hypothetical protein
MKRMGSGWAMDEMDGQWIQWLIADWVEGWVE